MTLAAADVLLLAKIALAPEVGFSRYDWTERDALETRLLDLAEQGLVTLGPALSSEYTEVTLTAAGQAVAATVSPQMLADADSGEGRAQAAMWLWLVLHGGTPNFYGGDMDAYGEQGEVAHLLACGLDLAASGTVRDGTWAVFEGTFVDSGTRSGVVGYATCRCEDVYQDEIAADVPSVSALLAQVLAL